MTNTRVIGSAAAPPDGAAVAAPSSSSQWRIRVGLAAIALACVLAASLAPTASAATIPVSTLADAGPDSLRAAIGAANADPAADTIQIGVSGTIDLQTQLPSLDTDLTIAGPGPGNLTVRRAVPAAFGIFNVNIPGADVTIEGLSVSNGLSTSIGGGIASGPGTALTLRNAAVTGNAVDAVAFASGGGITSFGSLTIERSTIDNNTLNSQTEDAFGGGIDSFGPLTIDSSLIAGNTATAITAGKNAQGGGVNRGGAPDPVVIRNTTISGNSAVGGGPTNAEGGGARLIAPAELTAVTIVDNSSVNAANLRAAVTTTMSDTVFAHPGGGGPNCGFFGTTTSGGFNLADDASCALGVPGDIIGIDPLLGPLADNGGPTMTRAPLPGSPLTDAGRSFGVATDQRGRARPADLPDVANAPGGDGSDIGAFEAQPPAPPAPPAPQPPPGSCAGREVTLVAVAGQPLVGTSGDDVIRGSDGADRIDAGGGKDLVCAGRGPDTVKGGAGDDRLKGNGGKDRLSGGPGSDRLLGGPSRDRLGGGPGVDACGVENEDRRRGCER